MEAWREGTMEERGHDAALLTPELGQRDRERERMREKWKHMDQAD
jgi:hypothetical protein